MPLQINVYKAFNEYIKQDIAFNKVYQLTKGIAGAFRFNVNGMPIYTGYTGDLYNAIPREYFRKCAFAPGVTLELFPTITKSEARAVIKEPINWSAPVDILIKITQ